MTVQELIDTLRQLNPSGDMEVLVMGFDLSFVSNPIVGRGKMLDDDDGRWYESGDPDVGMVAITIE